MNGGQYTQMTIMLLVTDTRAAEKYLERVLLSDEAKENGIDRVMDDGDWA